MERTSIDHNFDDLYCRSDQREYGWFDWLRLDALDGSRQKKWKGKSCPQEENVANRLRQERPVQATPCSLRAFALNAIGCRRVTSTTNRILGVTSRLGTHGRRKGPLCLVSA